METINTLAADARSNGRARTRDEWSLLLGRVNFETVLREGLFIGPSGVDTVECQSCTRPGHAAPALASRHHPDSYHVFCEESGIMLMPASQVEGYQVRRESYFRLVAIALQVAAPEAEYARLQDDLHFLGIGHLGKRRYSVIAAMSQRTDKERQELARCNRKGFGGERGVILSCDPVPPTEAETGFHALRRFGDVLELSAGGIQPRRSEIHRVLGLSGRPGGETTKVEEAHAVFLTIFKELGRIPRGQEAFRLFRAARPDLKVSDATLYEAKSSAIIKHRSISNL